MKFDDIKPGMAVEFDRKKKDTRKDEDDLYKMQHGIGTVISRGPFLFTMKDAQGRKISITRNEIITGEFSVINYTTKDAVVENKVMDYTDHTRNHHIKGHHWEVRA